MFALTKSWKLGGKLRVPLQSVSDVSAHRSGDHLEDYFCVVALDAEITRAADSKRRSPTMNIDTILVILDNELQTCCIPTH